MMAAESPRAAPAPGPGGLLHRLLLPSLGDFLILALVAWMFMSTPDGWSLVLGDCDTGWHIRTGDYILEKGLVPRQDLYSFSKPGETWFAWEWGADVIFSLVHRAAGLKGIVLLAVTLLALFGTLVFRFQLWLGVNVFIALGVTLATFGATLIHHHARPHLFTLVLVPAALWMLEADRRLPRRRVWLLVPLSVVWTNLHGGFFALPAMLLLMAAGSALGMVASGPRSTWNWQLVRRYAALAVACLAASLANPYGPQLHRHVFQYLGAEYIRSAVLEFQSPRFRGEPMMFYEFLLLAGLMGAAARLMRRDFIWPLWVVFWAHQSLGSARHVTILATVAAPVVGVELTLLWDRLTAKAPARSVLRIFAELARDAAPSARYTSVWPLVLLAILAAPLPLFRWPRDFPSRLFPTAMVARYGDLLRQGRVLTSDQWADYLIYHHYPQQRVWLDGRSDFYGERLVHQYISAMNARHSWSRVLEQHRFDVALVPVEWPLGSVMKADRSWKLLADDGQALLFVREKDRREPDGRKPALASAGKIDAPGLMNPPQGAESMRGALIP